MDNGGFESAHSQNEEVKISSVLPEKRPTLIAPKIEKRIPRWKKAAKVAGRTLLGLLGLGASAAVPLGINATIPEEADEIAIVTPTKGPYRGTLDNASPSTQLGETVLDSKGRGMTGSFSGSQRNEFSKSPSETPPPIHIEVPKEVSQNLFINKDSLEKE